MILPAWSDYSSPKSFVDDERRSCFDSALRATLSTNGITGRRGWTVRPERRGAKSKGEQIQFFRFLHKSKRIPICRSTSRRNRIFFEPASTFLSSLRLSTVDLVFASSF